MSMSAGTVKVLFHDPARLRELRRERGLTQESLAAAAGRSSQYVSGLEHGAYSPGAGSLLTIARVLGCDPAEILAAGFRGRPPELFPGIAATGLRECLTRLIHG